MTMKANDRFIQIPMIGTGIETVAGCQTSNLDGQGISGMPPISSSLVNALLFTYVTRCHGVSGNEQFWIDLIQIPLKGFTLQALSQ